MGQTVTVSVEQEEYSSSIYESILINDTGTSEKDKISDIALTRDAFHQMEVLLSNSLKLELENGWEKFCCDPCEN